VVRNSNPELDNASTYKDDEIGRRQCEDRLANEESDQPRWGVLGLLGIVLVVAIAISFFPFLLYGGISVLEFFGAVESQGKGYLTTYGVLIASMVGVGVFVIGSVLVVVWAIIRRLAR
jgi:hypothetical protein